MTMSFDDHLGHLEREVVAFDEAWVRADPGDPVPPCPGWSARDLRNHTAEVLAFWLAQLGDGASADGPHLPGDLEEEAGRDVADLGGELVATLRRLGADRPTWNWSREPRVSSWVGRRMAQELAVHRVDAELVDGSASPIDAALARDGIDEFLDVFVPAEAGTEMELAPVLRLEETDGQRAWVVAVSGDGVRRVEREPAARLTGSASDILLALWNRPSAASWDGDPAMPERWRELARIE